MSYSGNKVSLGEVLQQAGLVSTRQLEHALEQQKLINNKLRIGEILAIQEIIDSKTANFFAKQWSKLIVDQPQQPIGQYFQQAGLLSEQQIQAILDEQNYTNSKFGELAIAKGWLKQDTVNFFLRYLKPESLTEAELMIFKDEKSVMMNENKDQITQKQGAAISLNKPSSKSSEQLDYSQKVHAGFLEIKRKLLKIESQKDYSEKTLDRVLFWTGGQSFLTQKLFEFLAKNTNNLDHQSEDEQIDNLVQTKIINDWENNQLRLHLQTIKERLLKNFQCRPIDLLAVYQKILTELVLEDQSPEQQELLNMGLVVKQQGKLAVANAIYQSVFNLSWVTRELNQLAQSHSLVSVVPETVQNSSNTLTKTSTKATNNWFKFKNIFLLLALLGLITLFINNISKRLKVRFAFQTGNELLKQKSFTEAMIEYNRLLNINSNYFQAWTNRGYALAGLKKYEEMRESCSTATIINPTAVYAWNCQGEALHNLQRYPEAIAAFDKAIALNKTDSIFLINKSESLKALGREEASIAVIESAIQVLDEMEALRGKESISGEFAVALTFLGNGYQKREQYQDAIATYERAITYSANYFSAHIGKGMTLIKAGQFPEAQQTFENMLKNVQLNEAQQSQTWFHLGKARCKSGQYASGIVAFERAIELKPDYKIAEEGKRQCR